MGDCKILCFTRVGLEVVQLPVRFFGLAVEQILLIQQTALAVLVLRSAFRPAADVREKNSLVMPRRCRSLSRDARLKPSSFASTPILAPASSANVGNISICSVSASHAPGLSAAGQRHSYIARVPPLCAVFFDPFIPAFQILQDRSNPPLSFMKMISVLSSIPHCLS